MKRLLLLSLAVLVFISTGNAVLAEEAYYKKISVSEYRHKVYASWLGQCVGNIYGLPHENQYIDEPVRKAFLHLAYRIGQPAGGS